jgi:RimJ/RimL family protein N-acetyltransferase
VGLAAKWTQKRGVVVIDARNYEANEVLKDGQRVTIRAIRPDDKEHILKAFPEVDKNSLYLRFFKFKKDISDQELRFLTEVDFINHMALVVFAHVNGRDKLIGGGRYIAYGDPVKSHRAEVAFLVHDNYHGQGIATIIMKHLVIIARSHGISEFEADVLPENKSMLAVFSHAGLTMSTSRIDNVIHIVLSLSSDFEHRGAKVPEVGSKQRRKVMGTPDKK